jgi:dTDP-4-amino-4,6-dideoxygalactose transaminase
LLINFNKLTISKDKFIQLLNKKNIFVQVHYKPIHKLSLYASIKGKFKVAENFYESEISLPSFFNLTKKQMNYVVLSIKKIVYKHQKA